ncbi:MAG: glycosyltransferase family 39 protein [Patescibacteria group bacterium]
MNLFGHKIDWKIIVFLLAISVGIFLRVYHFNDWLLAKGDQVRDAMMVSHSYNGGPGELPLLGPRAGGTLLRLGPGFYYLQYLSTLVFQSTNLPVFAYPNLLFSILTIGVFYLLLRKYFERDWSMLLTGLFSLSYLAIEYSRFAWNPNSVPFFFMLFILAMLEIFNPQQKHITCWLIAAAVAFYIATQLHYSVFLALPAITILFLAINKKSLKQIFTLKQAAIFLLIVFLFYIPVILSDILTHGNNIHEFFSSISTKSSDHPLIKNIAKDYYYFGKYFVRVLTGYFGSVKTWRYLGEIFVALGLALNFMLWRKEKEANKKNFLLVSLLMFGVFFMLYIPLGYSIDKPRFFLPLFFLPFSFLGFLGLYIPPKISSLSRTALFSVVVVMIMFANVYFVYEWFRELKISQVEALSPKQTVILKTKGDPAWWTWSHFQKLACFMDQNCPNGEIYYLMGKNVRDYAETVDYAFGEINKNKPINGFTREFSAGPSRCYFYIFRTNDSVPDRLKTGFNIVNTHSFGSMNVAILASKDSVPTLIKPDNEETQTSSETSDEEEQPARVPRMFWKDVFK